MLKAIGVSSIEELFADIPKSIRAKPLNIPQGRSEYEVMCHFKSLPRATRRALSILSGPDFMTIIYRRGGCDSGEVRIYTAYTLISRNLPGWLQAIYEYQSAICELTGLDASNASLYDGGTALYEAAMMATKITGRNKIIMDSGVNLLYRSMLYTYTSNLSIEFVETNVSHGQSYREEIYKHLDDKTAAVIVQNPNFFGAVDDHSDIAEKAHKCGALAIQSPIRSRSGCSRHPERWF